MYSLTLSLTGVFLSCTTLNTTITQLKSEFMVTASSHVLMGKKYTCKTLIITVTCNYRDD